MARITINIDAEDAASSELIPTGVYDAVVDEVVEQASKSAENAGKPMYRTVFKIEGGDYAGRKATSYICLWQGAHFSLLQLLKAIGTEVKPGTLTVPSPKELTGKKVAIKIVHEPYEDEMTYKVGRILPRKGGASGAVKARVPFATKK